MLIILVVILVMFGGAKLPDLARSLGKAKREFQRGVDEGMPGSRDDRIDATGSEHATGEHVLTSEADGPPELPTQRPDPPQPV